MLRLCTYIEILIDLTGCPDICGNGSCDQESGKCPIGNLECLQIECDERKYYHDKSLVLHVLKYCYCFCLLRFVKFTRISDIKR